MFISCINDDEIISTSFFASIFTNLLETIIGETRIMLFEEIILISSELKYG